MKSKTKSTNTYGYAPTPPNTEDMQALRGMKAGIDPTIPYSYARAREDYGNTWQNPLGSATSPATREAANRVTNQRFGMDEANAMSGAYSNAENTNYARQFSLTQMTNPQLVQTGGTSSTPQPILPALIGAGSSLGVAAL